ncbi:GNAT family N-acetyltransferase [Nitrosospira sp. Nsp13]|uniref:GNAT family N-acetyltransferase n=1 Tax=Nitrosospira sp. Nsp13 TaxID=1855332 RepID=UPI00088AA049|nr:GNAT family N-acetyltransferase [Nitrosospira sp. Nsp13]SCY51599.1 Protein N-acetyltransferase, RimJ/RimL family [Nitrosospira sp. Nsp13]
MGIQHEQIQEPSAHVTPLKSRPDGTLYVATLYGNTLLLQTVDGEENPSRWKLTQQSGQLKLEWTDTHSGMPDTAELLAALEASFTRYPNQHQLNLVAPVGQADELLQSGVLLRNGNNHPIAYSELFWQQARIWLPSPQPYAFPSSYVFSQGRRHPLRPPKPAGIVYQRHIPWLDRTLSFRAVNIEYDLERFNRWMNDPVVAHSWGEQGDLAKHQTYLEGIAADPHTIGLVGCFDDEAFGYFEVYWAKEDRIAPFYDADDFDRGWHVLIGEPHFRGKPFVTAWMPSLSHYLFLDDCRTRRIVIEPRSDNYKMIRNLVKCGYANLKEFDFPHKRAMLSMLLRERFFVEQLWVPRDAVAMSISATPL